MEISASTKDLVEKVSHKVKGTGKAVALDLSWLSFPNYDMWQQIKAECQAHGIECWPHNGGRAIGFRECGTKH